MSSENQERQALDLLQEVLQVPPAHRQEFVNQRCADDDALRAEIMDLLREASATHDSFLEESPLPAWANAASPNTASPSTPSPPDRLGAFRVMEPLGEGGMGMVWMGLQERPVRRRVALKVIRRVHERRARQRFTVECQALAQLSHPNVAALYEVGETAHGDPFVAMELIEGCDIAEFCDRQRLGLRPRLELFRQVCAAVSHAHEQGILHLDLKPSNVLVTEVDGRPVPKVIDFGIAHIVDDSLLASASAPEEGQILGSPAYMSPEAARGSETVDPRSDVYSLGLLLYELLAGALPFEVETQTLFLLRQRASRLDLPPPSERFNTLPAERQQQITERRGVQTKALLRQLRGDLDAIVSRAIAQEPGARYSRPSDLANDLENHLRMQPVSARPATWNYLLGRTLRRRAAPMAALLAILLVLGIGLVVGAKSARQGNDGMATVDTMAPKSDADAHRRTLDARSQQAEQLIVAGRWAEAAELLSEIIPALETQPDESPILLANNLLYLGRTLEVLGRLESAYEAVERAFDLFLVYEEETYRELLIARILRARIKAGLGYSELAELEAQETLGWIRAQETPHLDLEAFAHRTLAGILNDLGRTEEAEPHRLRALELDELAPRDRSERAPPLHAFGDQTR